MHAAATIDFSFFPHPLGKAFVGSCSLRHELACSELERDGVDTSHIMRAPGCPSPFTYIIVDKQGGTRTCIHTPGAGLGPEEMTQDKLAAILEVSTHYPVLELRDSIRRRGGTASSDLLHAVAMMIYFLSDWCAIMMKCAPVLVCAAGSSTGLL